MIRRTLSVLVFAAAVGACERESQQLPFDPAVETVTRTIPADGGVITLPARASVRFPAGALGGATTVTLSAATAAAVTGGEAASSVYELAPSSLALSGSAEVSLTLDRAVGAERAWLASVVRQSAAGLEELGNARVDLSSAAVHAGVRGLGLFFAVIPEPAAVLPLAPLGSKVPAEAPAPFPRRVGADSLHLECGGPQNRCTGISAQASANLLSPVRQAAVVYPRIRGGLRYDRATSRVQGRISVEGAVRALLASGATTASLMFSSGEIRVDQHVAFPFGARADARADGASPSAGAAASTVVITLEETVRVVNSSGVTEDATIVVSVPVQLF